ncbi:MAG: hypothetical protein PHR35_10350 [Kiritimatiellae bacterium]|nr:hypothetical protein [Kiritimatiellia bacterium]
MQTNCRSLCSRGLALGLMLTLFLAGSAQAQMGGVSGAITTTEGRRLAGQIRWLAVARKYTIATAGAGGSVVETEILPDKVAKIEVPEPRELAPALKAVRDGKGAAAIPVLEKIARDYAMLQWDEPAANALAGAHMQNNDAAAAIKACEAVIAANPEAAYQGGMAILYWQALLKDGRTAKLTDLLDEAIKKGGREASAYALILRGDMLMEKKQPRDALKDGYLRVVVLYENVRSAQPEALYKAAKAFEALQQNPNAEKMRTLLRTKYAASEFAKKL